MEAKKHHFRVQQITNPKESEDSNLLSEGEGTDLDQNSRRIVSVCLTIGVWGWRLKGLISKVTCYLVVGPLHQNHPMITKKAKLKKK